ncbi:hypothetical protein ACTL6U_17620 [Rhodovibrionaceae bacterium A322]
MSPPATKEATGSYQVQLLGAFRLLDAQGNNCAPKGRKACALLALLIVAPQGTRARRWLQDKLWSDRAETQGNASLRQALSELRKAFGDNRDILASSGANLSIDLSRLNVDVLQLQEGTFSSELQPNDLPEFLEGVDLTDPEFEDWVRDQRSYWEDKLKAHLASQAGRDHTGESTALTSPLASSMEEELAAPLSDRTILAILPLENRTGEPRIDHFSEGLSEDLIERLSRLRWLAVISRSTTFTFQHGEQEDPREFAARLGARYVLQGAVRIYGDHYQMALRLVQCNNGFIKWFGRFEVDAGGAPSVLNEVVDEIVGTLDAKISAAEQQRALNVAPTSADFNNLIWRGRWHLHQLSKQDSLIAEDCFRQAHDLAPDAPEALVQLTWCLLWRLWATRGTLEDIHLVRELAQKAIKADNTDGRSFWLAGTAEVWLRRMPQARSLIEEAIRLSPSLSVAHAQLGGIYTLSGHPKKALAPLETALRLSPDDHHLFYLHGEQAMAYWMLGEWKLAAEKAELAISRRSTYWYAHMIKFSALLNMGDQEQASLARKDLFRARPDLQAEDVAWLPFSDSAWSDWFLKELGFEKPSDLRTPSDEQRNVVVDW